MGMTINDSISIFENKGKYSLTEKENEAKKTAIDTMRKYQKIEQIINNAKDSDGAIRFNWLYERIKEVLEDGNDD